MLRTFLLGGYVKISILPHEAMARLFICADVLEQLEDSDLLW